MCTDLPLQLHTADKLSHRCLGMEVYATQIVVTARTNLVLLKMKFVNLGNQKCPGSGSVTGSFDCHLSKANIRLSNERDLWHSGNLSQQNYFVLEGILWV